MRDLAGRERCGTPHTRCRARRAGTEVALDRVAAAAEPRAARSSTTTAACSPPAGAGVARRYPAPRIPLCTRSDGRDALRLRGAAKRGARPLVVGAGFIGCEAAASLARRGIDTALVAPEPLPQAHRLGRRAGGLHHRAGSARRASRCASAPRSSGSSRAGAFASPAGDCAADLVLSGPASRPAASWPPAPVSTVEDGAVLVDASMRRLDAAVLAVGDIAAAEHARAGRRLRVEHWGDALAHGEVAGRALAGEDAAWTTAPGFWTTIGDHTLKYSAWGDGFDEARVEADEATRISWCATCRDGREGGHPHLGRRRRLRGRHGRSLEEGG